MMMPTLAADVDEIALLVMICGGVFVAILIVVMLGASSLVRTRERESTKREIAAYVAEGSISPEDAATLLTAGEDVNLARSALAMGASPRRVQRVIEATRAKPAS